MLELDLQRKLDLGPEYHMHYIGPDLACIHAEYKKTNVEPRGMDNPPIAFPCRSVLIIRPDKINTKSVALDRQGSHYRAQSYRLRE